MFFIESIFLPGCYWLRGHLNSTVRRPSLSSLSPPDRGCSQRRALPPLRVIHSADEEPAACRDHSDDCEQCDAHERLGSERWPEVGQPPQSPDHRQHTEETWQKLRPVDQPAPQQRLEAEENERDRRSLVIDLNERKRQCGELRRLD